MTTDLTSGPALQIWLSGVLPREDRTVEYLKSKLMLKSFEESNNKEDQQSSNVFSVDMRGRCFTCGKPGHRQSECQQAKGRGSNRGRSLSRGKYRKGYYRCVNREDNARGSYNRGSYNRANHNRGSYNCGSQGRAKGFFRSASNSWPNQDGTSVFSNTFLAEVNNSQVEDNLSMLVSKNRLEFKTQIDWILDSGCTYHIVNNNSVFNEFTRLQKPIDV